MKKIESCHLIKQFGGYDEHGQVVELYADNENTIREIFDRFINLCEIIGKNQIELLYMFGGKKTDYPYKYFFGYSVEKKKLLIEIYSETTWNWINIRESHDCSKFAETIEDAVYRAEKLAFLNKKKYDETVVELKAG